MIEPTTLCNIMINQGSDKGGDWHNYTVLYSHLFDDTQDQINKLFELGIGSINPQIKSHMKKIFSPGGSLRGWREYFKNAIIFAADIDKDILEDEEKIKKFFVDQTDPNTIIDMWHAVGEVNFDIIIDDGLHTFTANKIFFENSYMMLSENGIFIIEDIPNNEIHLFKNELFKLAKSLNFESKLLKIKHKKNNTDNNVMIITKNKQYLSLVDNLPKEFASYE